MTNNSPSFDLSWLVHFDVRSKGNDKNDIICSMKLGNNIGWYLSYEVLYFEYEDNTQDEFLVWENLVLIRAETAEEALRKANSHGQSSEESLTINDKKGFCRFKGVRELVQIHEEIGDGAEIEWREFELSKKELDSLIPMKHQLQAFRENE